MFYQSQEHYQTMVEIFKEDLIINDHGGMGSCDCSTIEFDKGSAIAYLLDYFHIDKDNAYAFGDGYNDQAMFREVGHGIAMGNACLLYTSLGEKNEMFDDDALVYYIVKVIEHHEDIHQVPDKNYIASDIIDLIQKDHDYYDLLEQTQSIMKRLIKICLLYTSRYKFVIKKEIGSGGNGKVFDVEIIGHPELDFVAKFFSADKRNLKKCNKRFERFKKEIDYVNKLTDVEGIMPIDDYNLSSMDNSCLLYTSRCV